MPGSPEPRVSHGFVVDVVDLLRWPGSRIEVVLDEPLAGTATSAATAHHVHGTLVVESMADSLTVTGVLAAGWVGECRRCLGEARGTAEVDIQEIYERHPVDGETFPLTDDRVDLEPMVTELVVLGLPLAPLCGVDCQGPAPDLFPTSVVAEPDPDAEPVGDPRWAALDDLVFDDD